MYRLTMKDGRITEFDDICTLLIEDGVFVLNTWCEVRENSYDSITTLGKLDNIKSLVEIKGESK